MAEGDPNDPIQKAATHDGISYAAAAAKYPQLLNNPTTNPAQGPVYWEGKNMTGPRVGHVRDSDLAPTSLFQTQQPYITKSQNDAMAWLIQQGYSNTPQYQKIVADLIAAGAVKPGDGMPQILNAWSNYLTVSALSTSKGGTLSPMDFIAADARLNSGGGPTVTHSTSTTVNKMSAADVAARTQGVAQNALGRRLTAKEAAAYNATASSLEAANPSVSHTTTTTNAAKGQQTSSTVSTGGVGAGAIDEALLHQAMQNPEYGAYQAAGYYFPVLQQALGAVTGAGA